MITAFNEPWYKVIWNLFPAWALIVMIAYVIYGVFRTWYIFRETMSEGFFRGLFDVYLGDAKAIYETDPQTFARKIVGYEPKYLRLYHIIWMVIDIPCIVVGSCLPFIRRVFTFKIAPLKRPAKEEIE